MSSFIIYEIIFGRLCLDVRTLSGYKDLILLFVAFIELLGLVNVFFYYL
jgi:hypothetical protein